MKLLLVFISPKDSHMNLGTRIAYYEQISEYVSKIEAK